MPGMLILSKKVKVLGSNDGTNWTQIYENNDAPWSTFGPNVEAHRTLTFTDNTTPYIYFKFEYGGDSGENLNEHPWVPSTQLMGSYKADMGFQVGTIMTTDDFVEN